MLTPAMSDSRTSVPDVIIAKAFSTQVTDPPFLYWLPLDEDTTAGFTLFFFMTVGDCPKAGAAAAAASPAVLVTTKSRREILSAMRNPHYSSGLRTGSVIVDYLFC